MFCSSIDTPRFINKVANLFKGHSDLIVGFNAFLDPADRIEIQTDEINVHHQPSHHSYPQQVGRSGGGQDPLTSPTQPSAHQAHQQESDTEIELSNPNIFFHKIKV